MSAFITIFSTWGVPALTAPFVLSTWIMIFGTSQFGWIEAGALLGVSIPDPHAVLTAAALTPEVLIDGITKGIGEVMFNDNVITGIIFVVAIAINSRISAIFAILGSFIGLLTGYLLQSPTTPVQLGLYGYNSVLCGIAVGGLFYFLNWKTTIYTIFCIVVGAIAQASITSFLAPIGMPPLTWPFIITTWIFMLGAKNFASIEEVPSDKMGTPEDNLKLKASM